MWSFWSKIQFVFFMVVPSFCTNFLQCADFSIVYLKLPLSKLQEIQKKMATKKILIDSNLKRGGLNLNTHCYVVYYIRKEV